MSIVLRPFWLDADTPMADFPHPSAALTEPNGLLAAGGDLHPQRLLQAYRQGIFPWFSEGQPILWWSPDPRAVLFPADLHISHSLKKVLKRERFQITVNRAFADVVAACAADRDDQRGTWITADMHDAYCRLHAIRGAHSVETWLDGELVGGLYGVAMGRLFFGESMFARVSDASKVALAHLAALGFELIDCQLETGHLQRMGATTVSRESFLTLLKRWRDDSLPARFVDASEVALQ